MAIRQESKSCVECGSKENLVEHHTSYGKDETVTVCRGCHGEIHSNENHRLHPVDDRPSDRANMKIDESTKERLYDFKRYSETYDDLLNRLMDEVEDAS